MQGLRSAGWPLEVHELAGRFPDADRKACAAAAAAVRRMGDGMPVIDGLALPAFRDLSDRLPRPWVGLIHHPLALETGLSEADVQHYAELEGRLMRGAEKLIVTSPMTRRDLAAFDIDPERVAVVIPGVEPAAPAAGSGAGRPTSLLCVGTLTRRKGYPVLLRALAMLGDLDWRLTVVGSASWDPGHAGEIEELIGKAGLSSRVTVIGEQDEAGLAAFYDQADLFVLASHHEGYGMVLAEALARGLPIVSTTAGAIPDTVPAAAGRLVPPGDADALAAALRAVLTDQDLYQDLKRGAAGARRCLPDWTAATRLFAIEIEGVSQP